MIPLPDEDWSQPDVIADWIELNSMRDEFTPRGDVVDYCKDSTLWASIRASTAASTISHQDAIAEAWRELARRRRVLDGAWPFELTEGQIVSRKEYVYASLLLADVGRKYGTNRKPAMNKFRTLFEQVVAASLPTLVGGLVTRFGPPYPSEWPSGFPSRVQHLSQKFGLDSRLAEIPRLTSKQQQDDGLDVLSRVKLGDEEAGTVYCLVQCATGSNWRRKRGEPSLEKWRKYIDWDGPILRAVAVPWALRPRSKMKRAHVDFDNAVILDRWRIVAGRPDKRVDSGARRDINRWVRAQLNALARD